MSDLVMSSELSTIVLSMGRTTNLTGYLTSPDYTTTEKANYLAINGDQISFLPAGRPLIYRPDGSWSDVGRQSGKPGRVLRSVLSRDAQRGLCDADFEFFANRVKAAQRERELVFERVRGEKIMAFYHQDNYSYDGGTLHNSCMRYDKYQNTLEFYADYPEVISLVAVREPRSPGLVLGRALVWETRLFGPVMDRSYGDDATVAALHRYAQEQGWPFRIVRLQPTLFGWGDRTVSLCLDVPMRLTVRRCPYLDTFHYVNTSRHFVANHSSYGYNNQAVAQEGITLTASTSRMRHGYDHYPFREFDNNFRPSKVRELFDREAERSADVVVPRRRIAENLPLDLDNDDA